MRPPPPPLPRLACQRWPTASHYWDEPVPAEVWADMARKYRHLGAAVGMKQGAEQRARLAQAAAAWPGCLKECQLVPPALYETWAAWAADGAQTVAQSRGAWCKAGRVAVPMWSDLHGLLRDLAAMRAVGPGPGQGGGLAERLGHLPLARQHHWPSSTVVVAHWGGVRLGAPLVWRWLAAVADRTPGVLIRALLPAARFGD